MQSKQAAAIAQIAAEKNIDADLVLQAIQVALGAAYRKDFGGAEDRVRVEFEPDTGLIRVFRQWEVVEPNEEGYLDSPASQYTLEQAKEKKKSAKIGDIFEEDVTPKGEFGRIAAQTAKQVLIQHIREAEREAIYNLYKDRVGELLNAQVQRVEMSGDVFLDLEKATIVLEPRQQIPNEQFYNGQRVKVFLERVDKSEKSSQIVISRTHPQMIAKLLEMEVPEIAEGNVVIKDIAREPGVRTKVSVLSLEEGVDPVGSCVGQKGVRIQAVTDELSGERIDIVQFDEDPVRYLMNALAPAKIVSVKLLEERKLAKVYVVEEQRSLAIGKNGQNVRLASKLSGWEIDILDFDEAMAAEAGESGEAPATEPVEATAAAEATESVEAPAEKPAAKAAVKKEKKAKKAKAAEEAVSDEAGPAVETPESPETAE